MRRRLARVPIIVADGVDSSVFSRSLGARLGPAYAVAWWRADSPDSASRAFVARFERAGGRPPRPADAMYYDAMMLAAQAVHDVGARRDAIRRYLGELGVSRPPYRGITGPISFTPSRPTNLVMLRLEAPAPAAGAR
jgi:ABC-type branched-subunit amino acid transport system substrate-binding protein